MTWYLQKQRIKSQYEKHAGQEVSRMFFVRAYHLACDTDFQRCIRKADDGMFSGITL